MAISNMPMNTVSESSVTEGTFEYIEAKIRRDAEGNLFSHDFEWLCQWFLENAPRYRGQFDRVWLWDWPERWGPDAGIDLTKPQRLRPWSTGFKTMIEAD